MKTGKWLLVAGVTENPGLTLFTIDEVFGGWQKAQKTHLSEGGVFDYTQQVNR